MTNMQDLIARLEKASDALRPFAVFWENAGKVGESRYGDILEISDGTNRARLSYGMIKRAASAYRKLAALKGNQG